MPIHLKVKKGDYAPTVLLVGDPGRADKISKVLQKSKLVNDNRALFGYTGEYAGKKISVQTTGMGCPSAAIVVEELIQLDVKRFIRIGTCGGIGKAMKPLDIVAAVAAAPFDGTTQTYLKGAPHAPYATFSILKTAYDTAKSLAIDVCFSGVASVDVFYNPSPDYVKDLRSLGITAVEMETSLIYYLANRSSKEAASFLLVSDIVGGDEHFTKYVTEKDLAKGMDTLINFVLEIFKKL
jgi:DeoD family purine-nucleoside phosphorylase